MSRPAEVTQLDVQGILIHNEYVLWLNVSMDDIPFLHVDQCADHLSDDPLGFIIFEELLSFESLIQISVLSVLQHHVYALLIVEVTIQSDNVRVSESPLDLQLLFHLGEKVELLEQVLVNHLQCHLLI